jgi:type II secretory pathway component PulJ
MSQREKRSRAWFTLIALLLAVACMAPIGVMAGSL